MSKIISINENLINKSNNKMEILWMITDVCNFNCDYCLATERFLGKVVTKKEVKLFIKTINKIILENPNIEIKVLLSGGEPTLNVNIIDIIKELLNINNITTIEILTNGSGLKNIKDKLSEINSFEKIKFNCSFHRNQTEIDIFISNIKILKEFNIDFTITLLFPYNEEINKIKELVNYVKKFYKNEKLEIRLIIEGKNISQKYNKDTINYYNEIENINKNENITIKYSDGNTKKIEGDDINKIFFNNSKNRQYKGWTCYNYLNNYHIVRPDGVLLYGGCDVFRNTNLEMNFYTNFELIKKPNICTKNVCRCDKNITIPKIYNELYVNYYNDIDKILDDIKNNLNNNGLNLIIDKIRIINNGISKSILKINLKIRNIENKYLITTIGDYGEINLGDYFIKINRNDINSGLNKYLKELIYIEKKLLLILERKKIFPINNPGIKK